MSERSTIQIGAMYMGGPFSVKEFGQAAESAGFDSVWVGDHLAHYVDGIASLGVLAGCTNSVTIGTNVIVAPFRPAPVIAKGLLTIAASAARRVVLGIGPGGDVAVEFDMAGADLRTRGAYTDEAIDCIERLWSGDEVSYDGRWSRFGPIVMEPRSAQRPEIWVGGRSDAAVRRAVRSATGFNPYLVSPEQLADRYRTLRDVALAEHRDLDGFDFAATTFHVAGRSIDEAAERGHPACGFRGVSQAHFRRSYLLGDRDDVLVSARRFLAVGVRHLVIGCAPGAEQQLGSFVEVFEDVLPELRASNVNEVE